MKKSFYLGFLLLGICWVVSFYPQILPDGLSVSALRMVGVTGCISIFWLAQTMPIGATSLMPIFLLPLLEIMPAKTVASSYGSNIILLFMTGFFIAKAIERWGLHRRISLHIIKAIGTSEKRLILGFMVATAALSMWISNTACCLMMLPIAVAAIEQFKLVEPDKNIIKNFATCLMLSIAYAANIGGLGTPIGSSSNIIFLANFAEFFPDRPGISFLQWIVVSIPLVVVFLFLTWLYLVYGSPVKIAENKKSKQNTIPNSSGNNNYQNQNIVDDNLTSSSSQTNRSINTGSSVTTVVKERVKSNIIEKAIANLGEMSAAEKYVAILFAAVAILWIFLSDLTIGSFTIPGWSSQLGLEDFVRNTTVAAAIAFIMFAIPVKTKQGEKTYLLDWETANQIPWDILLLFGAGVAISKGFSTSGLSDFLTANLSVVLQNTPLFVTIITVSIFVAILTELASNTAISLLMIPICASVAPAIGIDPLILMWTAIKALKCTFCLPVATPPNAIVYSQKYFSIATMTQVGLFLNVIGIILISLTMIFIAVPIFS
ncbi:MAG: SLC13 family permease [Prochloraceae cyanobacterium]